MYPFQYNLIVICLILWERFNYKYQGERKSLNHYILKFPLFYKYIDLSFAVFEIDFHIFPESLGYLSTRNPGLIWKIIHPWTHWGP